MDFLDKLVLPQSAQHQALLHYVNVIVLFLFLPYLGILLGGMILSVSKVTKGIKTGDKHTLKLAKSFAEVSVVGKVAAISLGVLPIIVLMVVNAQLFLGLMVPGAAYLYLGLFMVTSGIMSSFFYAGAFSRLDVENKDSINALAGPQMAGLLAISALLMGSYFVIAGLSTSIYKTVLGGQASLFMPATLVKWAFFVLFSITISAAYQLFVKFYWNGGEKIEDAAYKAVIVKETAKPAIISALLIPVTILLFVTMVPVNGLSAVYFGLVLLSIFAVFGVFYSLYDLLKTGQGNFAGLMFASALLLIMLVAASDEVAVNLASKQQQLVQATSFEKSLVVAPKTK